MRASATVSAIAVLDLYDLLLALAVATKAEMLAAGLDREAMIDHGSAALPVQEQRLNESYLLALWQLAARNTAVPHIGLLVGQTYNPSTRGVLASWLFHCDDLGEALRVFQRHIALMNPSESWMLDRPPESCEMSERLFSRVTSFPLFLRGLGAARVVGDPFRGKPVKLV
jgi:Arabinose-binding domain of AraC transcription regulator, N-term